MEYICVYYVSVPSTLHDWNHGKYSPLAEKKQGHTSCGDGVGSTARSPSCSSDCVATTIGAEQKLGILCPILRICGSGAALTPLVVKGQLILRPI